MTSNDLEDYSFRTRFSESFISQISLSADYVVRSRWVTPNVESRGVSQRVYQSAAAREKVSYHVFVPTAYQSEKERRFPVVYWLHGSGGGVPGIAPLSRFFDKLMTDGNMPMTIVVFPNSMASGMWCDSVDGVTPIETVVVKEIIPRVDSEFRTVSDRRGRAVEGFSMGGYGAARFGFKYADLFSGVSMLAAGPLDLEFSGPRATANPSERTRILDEVYGGKIENFREMSPWKLAERHQKRIKADAKIRIVIGADDFTLESNRRFSGLLDQLEISHLFDIRPGVAHDTMKLLSSLGDDYGNFYSELFEGKSD